MKKRLFVVALSLFIGLSFFCDSWSEEGVTDTEIIIGTHQDLSGPIMAICDGVKKGMEMKIKETNDAGGIHGRKLRLVMEDTGYDPKRAVMAVNKLIERENVLCLLAPAGTDTCLATMPIFTKHKVPHLFPSTAADRFWDPFNRYSFATNAPYFSYGRVMTKYFVENLKYERLGALYQDDEFGESMLGGMKDQLASYNMKLIAAESYKRGATEFSSQFAKLRSANVQVVLLATNFRETVGALKETKKIGWQVDLVAPGPSFTHVVIDLATQAGINADGLYCASQSPYVYPDSEKREIKEFCERYAAMYGKPPQYHALANGYETTRLMEIALTWAGRDLSREKLIDALETFRSVPNPWGRAPATFTKTDHLGCGSGNVMNQVRGGRWVPISDFIDWKLEKH